MLYNMAHITQKSQEDWVFKAQPLKTFVGPFLYKLHNTEFKFILGNNCFTFGSVLI